MVDVRDSGTGLKDPDRIFEASTKESGMGMGLAICRSIIDAHHGRLWAASSEGAGTTFSFTPPVQWKADFDTSIVRNDTGMSVRWARRCRLDSPLGEVRVKASLLPQSCGTPIIGPSGAARISTIAARVGKTPAQVLLAWAVQRGTALLTTPRTAARARENLNISALPEDALDEINRIQTRQRFNEVVKTGSPGFIPQGR